MNGREEDTMNSYSDDLNRIRKIAVWENGKPEYFRALCEMQDLAMTLANEKFELTMQLAMMQGEPEPREFRPSWTARNSEEWQEVED